jgi:hypothetical protein
MEALRRVWSFLHGNSQLPEGKLTKEEHSMKAFNAESVDLSHLNPIRVSYAPKDIHTEAVQVTMQNIGKLSLEFEAELFRDRHGSPYFLLNAERVSVDAPVGTVKVGVREDDWIVVLGDELHVFQDDVFANTFSWEECEFLRPVSTNPLDENFNAVTYESEHLAKNTGPAENFRLKVGDTVLFEDRYAEVESIDSAENLASIRFTDVAERDGIVVALSRLKFMRRA